jgi:hypothetical protein
MKSSYVKALVVLALVAAGLALAIGGCGGGGAAATSTTTRRAALPSTATTTTTILAALPLDELSTFDSKDPFIQQAVPTTAKPSTTTGTGSTTTSHSTTTLHTTTTHSGSTSSTVPTSVTSPSHSLKVLSIDVITGTPVVTVQVDGTVYADKKVGDSFSTAWGGIKILAIDPQGQTVTLLHGSETRTLRSGQSILK